MQSSPGFQDVSFSGVPNDPVGCVACKRYKVGREFSNKVINVVDIVFGGLFSKDSDPGYKAVPLGSYAGLDNDPLLSCCPSYSRENLISEPCKHERAHFVCPLAEVIVCTSFQSEGLTDPLRIDHGVPTVRSHCSQTLNQRASLLLSLLSPG